MRTIQWYDMKWGPETTKVNDFATMTGKFHLAEDWPRAVGKPGRAFFNVGSPSPVFVRLSTKLNGEPTMISGPLEIGRDYAFEVKLKARIPGRHHMHAMVNIKDAGPIAGPAAWMNITGSWDDFTNPIKAADGRDHRHRDLQLQQRHLLARPVAGAWASSGLATTLRGPCSCRVQPRTAGLWRRAAA